jgi:hypothetical protein
MVLPTEVPKERERDAQARYDVCKIQCKQALDKSHSCDIQLYIGDNWMASAHEIVLRGRNAYFARMFEYEVKEKHSRKIKLEGVQTAQGLQAFVQFLYLGAL